MGSSMPRVVSDRRPLMRKVGWLQVKNHADGSQVRETLTSTGVNQVFWFDPEDAQELLNELYNKNFEKFMVDTTLDGKLLKLR
jgi:hypothetical protein